MRESRECWHLIVVISALLVAQGCGDDDTTTEGESDTGADTVVVVDQGTDDDTVMDSLTSGPASTSVGNNEADACTDDDFNFTCPG